MKSVGTLVLPVQRTIAREVLKTRPEMYKDHVDRARGCIESCAEGIGNGTRDLHRAHLESHSPRSPQPS